MGSLQGTVRRFRPLESYLRSIRHSHRIVPGNVGHGGLDAFRAHREEIMRLVRNHEKPERAEHPLKRIMAVEEKNGATLVTTADIHLARGMGELLHHAYQGGLKSHYNPEQNLLRVSWAH
jgi:hypothetical protein